MQRPTPEQLERMRALGAATLHEAQSCTGAVDPAIRAVDPARRMAGTAYTVDCAPGDNLLLHHALEHAKPGDVLVVSARGFTGAGPWGDLMTHMAQRRGLAGLVIDGAVRDADAIIDSGFPVFSRGLCIRGTTKRVGGTTGGTVSIGGVQIMAGDVVVGDRDGLVVIPRDAFAQTLQQAIAREVKESGVRAEIDKGRSTMDIFGLAPAMREAGVVSHE